MHNSVYIFEYEMQIHATPPSCVGACKFWFKLSVTPAPSSVQSVPPVFAALHNVISLLGFFSRHSGSQFSVSMCTRKMVNDQ